MEELHKGSGKQCLKNVNMSRGQAALVQFLGMLNACADDFPAIQFKRNSACQTNPLGIKGAGEVEQLAHRLLSMPL